MQVTSNSTPTPVDLHPFILSPYEDFSTTFSRFTSPTELALHPRHPSQKQAQNIISSTTQQRQLDKNYQPQPVQGTFLNRDSVMFFRDHPFKMAVFPLITRHSTDLYAVALDVARHAGFRDTYTMFRKYGDALPKFWATEQERNWMADHGILVSANRYREIALVRVTQALESFGTIVIRNGFGLEEANNFAKKGTRLSKDEIARLKGHFNTMILDSGNTDSGDDINSSQDDKENIQKDNIILKNDKNSIQSTNHSMEISKNADAILSTDPYIIESFIIYNQSVHEMRSSLVSCIPRSFPLNSKIKGSILYGNHFPIALMNGQYQTFL